MTVRSPANHSRSDFGLMVIGLSFFLPRIPLIFFGYGLDPDSYYVLLSTRKMLSTGRYWMSRPPGYPLFELLCTVLSKGGYILTNGATVIISFLTFLIFTKTLEYLRPRHPRWLIFTFAFMPILIIQSTCTMDYMWAMFFLLAAYYLCLSKRYALSAASLGLAVGFRLTSVLMILPLSLQIFFQERKIRKLIWPWLIFGLVSLVVFSPVYLTYGLSFFNYVPSKEPFYHWMYKIINELLGFPAFLVLLLGLFLSLLRRTPRTPLIHDQNTIVYLITIGLYGLLYLRLPAEAAYLLPIIPFGLLFLDRYLPGKILIIFCVLIVFHGIVSLASFDKIIYRASGKIRVLAVDYGLVVKNEIRKRAIFQNAQRLLPLTEALPKKKKIAVIMAWYSPTFYFLHLKDLQEVDLGEGLLGLKRRGRDLFYLEGVSLEQINYLQKKDFILYYIDAGKQAGPLSGVNLAQYARFIPEINSYPVNY